MALPETGVGPGGVSRRPGTNTDELPDPKALRTAWRGLLRTHHHLHVPDAARMLGVPEVALIASRIGDGAVRLTPDIAEVLAPVSEWGRVLCAFSNPCGVHMPLGAISVAMGRGGVFCLRGEHMQAEIDRRAIADAYLFADHDDSHGNTRSIQFFDAAGAPVLKIFVFHKSKFEAAERHFAALTAEDQSRTVPTAAPGKQQFDANAASLAADPVVDLVKEGSIRHLLAERLEAGGAFAIEMVGGSARVTWRGALSGVRMDERMLHLHERDLRSHLRYEPMLRAVRTRAGALSIEGEQGRRLLRIEEGADS